MDISTIEKALDNSTYNNAEQVSLDVSSHSFYVLYILIVYPSSINPYKRWFALIQRIMGIIGCLRYTKEDD